MKAVGNRLDKRSNYHTRASSNVSILHGSMSTLRLQSVVDACKTIFLYLNKSGILSLALDSFSAMSLVLALASPILFVIYTLLLLSS
mmetsp:Transcript_40023/g.84058  ORF Transcript_40023/g.84058 Transcript_40023/m.84058 type:complete len:87 (-) Transcript_40023:22-282(-)